AVARGLANRVAAERAAADALLRAFAPLPGLHELALPDTVVCRCEDVTVQRARDGAALHGPSSRAIKLGCRAGMGPCQARICGPSLQALACQAPATAMDPAVVPVPVTRARTAAVLPH